MSYEVVKLGNDVTLYRGDCLEVMPTLEAGSVDMVFVDPPYGHNTNSNGDLIARLDAALGRGDYVPEEDDRPIINDGEEANQLFRDCLHEYNRLLKSPGCCCCCGGGGGGIARGERFQELDGTSAGSMI